MVLKTINRNLREDQLKLKKLLLLWMFVPLGRYMVSHQRYRMLVDILQDS